NQPTMEQPVAPVLTTSTSWLTDNAKPANTASVTPSEKPPVVPEQPPVAQVVPAQPPVEPVQPAPVEEPPVASEVLLAQTSTDLSPGEESPVQHVPAQEQDPMPVKQAAPAED